MQIRHFQDDDLATIANLFTASVHGLAIYHYATEQCHAWAPTPPDINEWRRRLANLQTLVAENHQGIVGFLSYEMSGHIDLLYTSPTHARHGVASMLYEQAETIFINSGALMLFTEASVVARPFFEKKNFVVYEAQQVQRRGLSFKRFVMHKTLSKTPRNPDSLTY
jgi:putative acetyltransferase